MTPVISEVTVPWFSLTLTCLLLRPLAAAHPLPSEACCPGLTVSPALSHPRMPLSTVYSGVAFGFRAHLGPSWVPALWSYGSVFVKGGSISSADSGDSSSVSSSPWPFLEECFVNGVRCPGAQWWFSGPWAALPWASSVGGPCHWGHLA